MTELRQESDLLGVREIPKDALWGIHTARAVENFPIARRTVHPALIHAYGAVKLAASQTNFELGYLPEDVFLAVEAACVEMIEGKLDQQILVDALQGGAGTSTNMNVNEVLSNRALQFFGRSPGEYHVIDPHDSLNLHQSTNDTYPTALRIAAIKLLRDLERKVVGLCEAFQRKEHELADVVKIGRTELHDAVPITLGREMSAYADALARDRWRIYKCEERLRVVNLGGTAIGTAIGAPRQYVFRVVEKLKQITGFGLSRAENLVDGTQNADAFVEVSGILRTLASNLYKIGNDLRLLSSGPTAGLGEIRLPARQAGSSIMPGKVNPVIPEAVCQAALAVMGHDHVIVHAVSAGNLELSQFLPLVADSLLASLDLLIQACDVFARLCVLDITADREQCRHHVNTSSATLTALVERIGYEAAEQLARASVASHKTLRELAVERQLLSEEEFDELTSAQRIMRLGSENGQPTPNALGGKLDQGSR